LLALVSVWFSYVCLLLSRPFASSSFFFNDTATTEIYTLSLHDALPIFRIAARKPHMSTTTADVQAPDREPERSYVDLWLITVGRSEEHTSELQSRENLVCRLLLEKKKKKTETSRTQRTAIDNLQPISHD